MIPALLHKKKTKNQQKENKKRKEKKDKREGRKNEDLLNYPRASF